MKSEKGARGVVVFIIFVFVIFAGAVIYSNLEGWNFLDSIYFSAVTITTLGYGDLAPKTIAGKIFTIFFSISGIAIGLYILTILGKNFFSIDIRRGVRVYNIRKNKKFNVEKFTIGMMASWKESKKEVSQGIISEIGLDYVKIRIEKKNGQLVPKNDQKIITITSDGNLKNI